MYGATLHGPFSAPIADTPNLKRPVRFVNGSLLANFEVASSALVEVASSALVGYFEVASREMLDLENLHVLGAKF